jgi:hypothetical protein
MNSFWQSLHQLTCGQLFARGYISPRTVVDLASRGKTPNASACGSDTTNGEAVRQPRLAIPQ